MTSRTRTLVPFVLVTLTAACSSNSEGPGGSVGSFSGGPSAQAPTGGSVSTGGSTSTSISTPGTATTGGTMGTMGTMGTAFTGGTTTTGGATSTGGTPGTAITGGSGGTPGTGGTATTGGDTPNTSGIGGTAATGGTATTGGTGTAVMAGAGGTSATGGTDAGGSSGSEGDPDDFWGGLGNPPVKSAGCGTPATITSGTKQINSAGLNREYIIDIPENYDPDEPHRLIYASHGLGGHAMDVSDAWFRWYGLKPLAEAANVPVIFIAPEAIGQWNETDHALFDDVTDFVKAELCVDTTRVFVTGMSFGGMITYSLSTNHQQRFRAGFAMAPANFNIYLPEPRVQEPIAWMQSTGMSDPTCPWDSGGGNGAKYIALEKAADNGCTVPDDIPTWDQSAPSRHICVDMENCKSGYPVKVCTFDGPHIQAPSDEGPGDFRDTPERSWVPAEAWDFFMQF